MQGLSRRGLLWCSFTWCGGPPPQADYFGSHLIRDPASLRALLIEGLAQSGDVRVPRVVIAKRLKVFLEDDLDALLPLASSARLVAHPYAIDGGPEPRRVMAVPPPVATLVAGAGGASDEGGARVLVAVGPEGGWDGAGHELSLLAAAGFAPIGLGPRVLRSDVAVSALLGLAHALVEAWDDGGEVSVKATRDEADDYASFLADLAC